MLAEALDVAVTRLTLLSREPLGAGSVSGFRLSPRAAGEPDLVYYLDTSGLAVTAETGLATDSSAHPSARIWLHPADPHLPALASVAFDHAAEALLARLGLAQRGAPEIVGYRPGRRAVLRVPTADGMFWVKVVRASRVERLARVHALAESAHLPVPAVHGWSKEGVLVLAQAVGAPAADVEWGPDALLDAVDELRERIAALAWPHQTRGTPARLDWYADRAVGTPAGPLAERVRRRIGAHERDRRTQVVHGDLHFGQLFLGAGGKVTGLIDIDTLGIGSPAEDPAAFLAHAVASALLTETSGSARVWALADGAHSRWCGDAMVAPLAATHLIGHALAAVDRGDPAQALLRVASALLDGAAPSSALDKSALTRPFESA